MKILRVNMKELKAVYEELPSEWKLLGGRGLSAKIMNKEVLPDADPLGPANKLIIAGGPLAGTMAPQLGRVSVGGKSPLTLGIKEANAGGPAAQKLDRLGIRAIIVERIPEDGKLYCLKISRDETVLVPADSYKGMKNYELVKKLQKKYGEKATIISIGIGGERRYKAATVALTDTFGDPSRHAGRGGLGAVMGSKGLKAIIIDDSGTSPVDIADKVLFRGTVKSWTNTLMKDISCQLFSTFGTLLAVDTLSYLGTMVGENYTSGRPEGFRNLSREVIKKNIVERGGRMHGCMPGCVVQCSIIYNDAEGKRLVSAYEYEGMALLGTNLGISDPDAIARLQFLCDDLGIDYIDIGSALGVAASAGKMKMGDVESALKLFAEIEQGTEFGYVLGNGVVSTAKALNVSRVPAFKGQAIPAHDPRGTKGMGVTYATSPMGADHTAGLTYRIRLQKAEQIENSLRAQVECATWDTFGYCLNAVPVGRASTCNFLADLMNARYGVSLTGDDIVEVAKETLKDELGFNQGAEFSKIYERYPDFIRTEPLPPTNSVFDVEDSELDSMWQRLETYKERQKIWEVRLPTLPQILFATGAIQKTGERAKALNIKKAFVIAGPVMNKIGLADRLRRILENSGVATVLFSEVEPDPPIEEVEKAGRLYQSQGCDGLVAMGGGSSLDVAKAIAVWVSQPGILSEYEVMVGGAGKIKPPLPPLICIPTTSGTGSEVNQYTVITDKQRDVKFIIMSDSLVPSLAVVDPDLCKSMPPGLTAETGIDALAHCIEGYVATSIPYHPYYEALALYGVKLIGRSLRTAYSSGDNIEARTDMCMAAINGGIAFSKGLGIGHAIGHAIGARCHLSHGKAVAPGLLCFARANEAACKEQFRDLAWALDGSDNLETALVKLYKDLNVSTRLSELGIPEEDLGKIAFETSKDVVNLTSNPASVSERQILTLLKSIY